ncbi:transmembrane protein, putative (macronuclear) [Tetrahymena thermophila SB210]|uniref:Transmembrane protein, putative n=1 Tax=Tetrahymena thermophila (strain SB210) TaxID=312017 RepID=W7X4I3_TETTS|nr:transmembrane protein, putative [Tetrahymena thermophila SB210]EWS74245.1 transmembrane protein, putative [Tetrahymena thermophila SB210]|eukprot:XP_012653218.1 transmembrane protein, putative [Tetrahymena thermophila SB210]
MSLSEFGNFKYQIINATIYHLHLNLKQPYFYYLYNVIFIALLIKCCCSVFIINYFQQFRAHQNLNYYTYFNFQDKVCNQLFVFLASKDQSYSRCCIQNLVATFQFLIFQICQFSQSQLTFLYKVVYATSLHSYLDSYLYFNQSKEIILPNFIYVKQGQNFYRHNNHPLQQFLMLLFFIQNLEMRAFYYLLLRVLQYLKFCVQQNLHLALN